MTTRGALVRIIAGAALAAGMLVASPAHAGPAYTEPPAAAAPSTSPATAGAPADASSTPSPAPTTEPPPEASKRTVWPWILMGTGVALVITAAVFQFRAISADDRSEDANLKLSVLQQGDTARPALVQTIKTQDDSASSSRTISFAVGTVGFLAIAGAVVWWFTEGASSAPSARPLPAGAAGKLKPTFTPSLSPSYAGASLGASF